MTDQIDALERLARLREQNILTDAEFEAAKARLLAPSEPAADTPATEASASTASEGPITAAVAEPGEAQAASHTSAPALKDVLLERKWLVIGALAGLAIIIGALIGWRSLAGSKLGHDEDSPAVAAAGTQAPSAQADDSQADGAQATATPATDHEIRLSSVLTFADPENCIPGDELQTLFDDMRTVQPGDGTTAITIGLDGPSVRPEVTRTSQAGGAIVARVVANGTWNGMRVTELRTTRFDGNDIESFQIRFRENPERVRSQLNEAGFSIDEPGELTSVELEDGGGLVYGVERVAQGSAFTCSQI